MIKTLKKLVPKSLKNHLKNTVLYKKITGMRHYEYEVSGEYETAMKNILKAHNMVDLGCGSNPHGLAKVAVDKYIEPIHRKFGSNQRIDVNQIENRGIKFVEADFECLPFKDKEFDYAFSHHVVEHLDDPSKALKEMMRVAERGVIICPGPLSEYIFGRIYHKWIVTKRNNTLIFIEKDWDGVLFGEGPYRVDGKIKVPKNCNPFDILLNDSNWYHGVHRYKQLTKLLRYYWKGHYSCMETVFNWNDKFDYIVIYRNGYVVSSF